MTSKMLNGKEQLPIVLAGRQSSAFWHKLLEKEPSVKPEPVLMVKVKRLHHMTLRSIEESIMCSRKVDLAGVMFFSRDEAKEMNDEIERAGEKMFRSLSSDFSKLHPMDVKRILEAGLNSSCGKIRLRAMALAGKMPELREEIAKISGTTQENLEELASGKGLFWLKAKACAMTVKSWLAKRGDSSGTSSSLSRLFFKLNFGAFPARLLADLPLHLIWGKVPAGIDLAVNVIAGVAGYIGIEVLLNRLGSRKDEIKKKADGLWALVDAAKSMKSERERGIGAQGGSG